MVPTSQLSQRPISMHERVETEAAKVGKRREEGKRRRESEVRSAAAAAERAKEAKIVVEGGENKPCSNCMGLKRARQVC